MYNARCLDRVLTAVMSLGTGVKFVFPNAIKSSRCLGQAHSSLHSSTREASKQILAPVSLHQAPGFFFSKHLLCTRLSSKFTSTHSGCLQWRIAHVYCLPTSSFLINQSIYIKDLSWCWVHSSFPFILTCGSISLAKDENKQIWEEIGFKTLGSMMSRSIGE